MREPICERLGVDPLYPAPHSKVGIAIQTLTERPIHGLRHPVDDETNGWFLWCGEYSDDDDFFKPLHIEHVEKYLPQVRDYLSLPPGFRFLIDDAGSEDVWLDDSLVKV